MRFAYADPPYPGQSAKHYRDHPDFDGEVDHAQLVERLLREFPDGWVLHTSTPALYDVLPLVPREHRLLAWAKPFSAWKRNQYPAFAWEPVILVGGRSRYGDTETPRDYIAEPITLRRGVVGAKPEAVCHWLFDCLGVEEGDDLVDLFPGSGAVVRAWRTYHSAPRILFPAETETEPML